MTGFLQTYLLESLEKDPERTFTASDLHSRGENELADLLDTGLLVPLPESLASGETSYRVNLAPLITRVRLDRNIKGANTPRRLHARLYYLGTSTLKAEVYSWFLALVTSQGELAGLLSSEGARYLVGERVVVVTPAFSSISPDSDLGVPYPVELTTLGDLGFLKVRVESVRRKLLLRASGPVLAAKIDQEIAEFGLHHRLAIKVLGIRAGGYNVVRIGEIDVKLSDRLLAFLLALLDAHFTEHTGWISTDALVTLLDIERAEIDRRVAELRRHLQGVKSSTRLLVESERLRRRVSVHRSFFSFDLDKLDRLHDKKVKKVVAKLKVSLRESA